MITSHLQFGIRLSGFEELFMKFISQHFEENIERFQSVLSRLIGTVLNIATETRGAEDVFSDEIQEFIRNVSDTVCLCSCSIYFVFTPLT